MIISGHWRRDNINLTITQRKILIAAEEISFFEMIFFQTFEGKYSWQYNY